MNMFDLKFNDDVRDMMLDMYHLEEVLGNHDDDGLIDEETVISGLTEDDVNDLIQDNLFDNEFSLSKLIDYGLLTSFVYDEEVYYKVTSEVIDIIFKD